MAKRDPYLSQAETEAFVRYNPQVRALAGMLADIQASTENEVGAAQAGARAISTSAREARPRVEDIYSTAAHTQDQAGNMLRRDLQTLGPVADSIKAAAMLGFSGADRRRAEAKSSTLTDLVAREQDAIAGGEFASRAARQEGETQRGRILEQIRGLQGEKGAFVAGRYADLLEGRRGRQLQRDELRAQIKDQRLDRELAERELDIKERNSRNDGGGGGGSRGGGGSKGPKRATRPQIRDADEKIKLAINQARRLKQVGRDRRDVGKLLVAGRGSQTVENEQGDKVKIPGVSRIPSLYASIALDQVFDSHVSRRNAQRLHDNGMKVRDFGLTSFTDWKRKHPASQGIGMLKDLF